MGSSELTGPPQATVWGVLFFGHGPGEHATMRTSFLVDGFNLYHSLKDASRSLGGVGTRWLDLFGLCRTSLHLIGRQAVMGEVYYFSALAKHLEAVKPDVTIRHRAYIECLRSTGVQVELA